MRFLHCAATVKPMRKPQVVSRVKVRYSKPPDVPRKDTVSSLRDHSLLPRLGKEGFLMSRTALFTKTNITAAVMVLVLGATGTAAWMNKKSDSQARRQSSAAGQQSGTSAAIDASSTPAKVEQQNAAGYVSYAGQDGKTALELLKTNVPNVKTKTSSIGEFVESINGKGGDGTKYWSFYINGEMSQVGAGTYQTKSTDKLEWKLQ